MADNRFNPLNPFANLDLGQFDPMKFFTEMKVPGMDIEGMMAHQRKNIEALTEANKAAVAGMQAVAKRQQEILTQAMNEANGAFSQLAGVKDPKELTEKQAEIARKAFEEAITNMRELAEMIQKSNAQALELINHRLQESMKELQALTSKGK